MLANWHATDYITNLDIFSRYLLNEDLSLYLIVLNIPKGNQLKGTPLVYETCNTNRFLSLADFTKATNLVISQSHILPNLIRII